MKNTNNNSVSVEIGSLAKRHGINITSNAFAAALMGGEHAGAGVFAGKIHGRKRSPWRSFICF